MNAMIRTAPAPIYAPPLLAGCTVNNPPAQPVVMQQPVAISPAVAPPTVVLQRYRASDAPCDT